MGCVDVGASLQHGVLSLRVFWGRVVATVGNVLVGPPREAFSGRHILGNTRRQDNVGRSVGPGNGQRVVCHGTSPGKTSPANLVRRDDLENCLKDIVGGSRVGNSNTVGDTVVAGVRGELETCLAIHIGGGVGVKLASGYYCKTTQVSQ